MEAVQSVDSANHDEEEDADDLDDDISVLEPEPLGPIEATKAVRALRNFVMTFDKSGAKEREFLRMQAKRRAIYIETILSLNINCCCFLFTSIYHFLYNLYVVTFLNRYSESVVFCKQKLRVCSKVKIITTESHHLKTRHFWVTKIALNCVTEVTCVTNQSLVMTSI